MTEAMKIIGHRKAVVMATGHPKGRPMGMDRHQMLTVMAPHLRLPRRATTEVMGRPPAIMDTGTAIRKS